jgi:putative ABC transport system permease protein
VRDFGELNPFYLQVKRFFGAIFLFISLIMAIIVLFTVVNTMTMAVLERTGEIGTSRALGVRRSGIRFQFMVEGFLLGAAGAAVGVVVALAQAALVNRAGLTWTPPANSAATPFKLALANHPALFCGAFAVISAVATVAALVPATRAARLQVVDALRHS